MMILVVVSFVERFPYTPLVRGRLGSKHVLPNTIEHTQFSFVVLVVGTRKGEES